MNTTQKKQLTAELIAYKEKTGLSIAQLGKLTGTKSYAGYIIKGKYEVPTGKGHTEISDAILNSLQTFLKGGFNLENDNLKRSIACFYEAKEWGEFRLLTSPTGRGKSHAARHFLKTFPKETFLIVCDGDMKYREFMAQVCRVLNLPSKGTVKTMRDRAVERILAMDNPLLIFDEAENLTNGNYRTIKALTDSLENRCGIVLIGADKQGKSYSDWLEDQAAAARGNFPQVASRFSAEPVRLLDMSWDDFQKMADHYGITETSKRKEIYAKARGDYRFATWNLNRIARKRNTLS